MKIINLGEKNSLLNRYIAEIRDVVIQKDSMRFRRNLERIGEIFAYEISKTLTYSPKEVETPLGIANCNLSNDKIILSTILRSRSSASPRLSTILTKLKTPLSLHTASTARTTNSPSNSNMPALRL